MFAKPLPEQTQAYRRRSPRRWLALAGLPALWLLLTTTPLFAANPPPVQIFYVPAPEDDVFTALKGIFPGPVPNTPDIAEPIITYVSISVIAQGTILYYDHWEDGYEIDISNPTQATTQIWGDGNPANGAPPGYPDDLLGPNTIIVLRSTVTLATRQSQIDFDGGDKFGATRSIAVTRAAWDSGAGTLLALAFEVYPVDEWGTSFRAPVGTDTPSSEHFEYVSLVIMATDDNTVVQVDTDADGVFDPPVTLNEGESYLTAGTIQEGARIQASAPVQVGLITGDINDDYEGRTFVLFPEEQWSNTYYSPVSASPVHGARAFMYNPHSEPLTVTRTIMGGAVLTSVIPAMSSGSMLLPVGSGARFASVDGRPFAAIAAVDTEDTFDSKGDWGFAMIPQEQLTTQVLIGWGVGKDPDEPGSENSSPVWVTAVDDGGTVQICVDFNSDNVGALTDGNGFHYDLRLDLAELQNARVFDPDGDQTGTLLYVCSDVANEVPTSILAAAWGQDPDISSPGPPALDLGTTAPPAATFEAGKAADIIVDLDGDGRADGGDTILYTVLIRNASRVPINGVTISDTVPANTSYVLTSTTVNTGTGTLAVPDNDSGTPFPLDEGGIALGDLPVNGLFTVTFAVLLDNPLPSDIDRIRNVAIVRAEGEERRPEVETPIDLNPLPAIDLVKTVSQPWVQPGTSVVYTFTVENSGSNVLTDVQLLDDQCAVGPASGDVDGDGLLQVAEVWSYTCSRVITRTTTNVAVVTAVDLFGQVVTDTDSARVQVPILYLPWIVKPETIEPCPPPTGCPLANEIKALAVNETLNRLYVVARDPDELLMVDPVSNEVLTRTTTGAQPWGIAVNEQTNRVYVSSFVGGDVRVYDGTNLALLATIPVGTNPSLVEYLPGTDTVFVLVRGGSRVAIINGLSLVQDISSVGSGPFGIAADGVNQRIFISHRDSGSLTMLRLVNGSWQSFLGPQSDDGRQYFEIEYSATNNRLFALRADAQSNWLMDVWEPKDNDSWGQAGSPKIMPSGGDINLPDVGGTALALNGATANLFNVNTGAASLSVIDVVTVVEIGSVGLGTDPFAIAIDESRNQVYVGLRAGGALIKLEDVY
ncbi:MAG: DUF11 domain-containing protein [Caldilineaceae bacterium]|nr:DUF11 domain-containing protein [Caldilineaceae bacterium]